MLKVSFLIAAYNVQKTLPSLVNKMLHQAGDVYPIELVISEDDGFNYKDILPNDTRIVYGCKGLKSLPGPARTRALNAATGSHISLLDADDDVSDYYLATIYRSLKTYNVFAITTVYQRNGVVVRSLNETMLNFNNLSKFYGSIHTVAPRHWTTKYVNITAEDVLATLNVLQRNNGILPVISAQYLINIHDDSYCAQNGAQFTSMYQKGIHDSSKIAKELKNERLATFIKQLYTDRLVMSLLFDKEISLNPIADYHQFVLKNNQ